jgi:DNA-binding response OmpR family regulator
MNRKSTSRKITQASRSISPSSRLYGVLVVEDDPDLQWSLARMLTVQGNRVVGTGSGEGALALLAQWPVDLVLVAEQLPGLSGIEVAEQIRSHNPQIPVVLMSAEPTPELRVAARLAGVIGCLTKPFRYEVLRDLIKKLPAWPVPSAVPAE